MIELGRPPGRSDDPLREGVKIERFDAEATPADGKPADPAAPADPAKKP